MTGIGGRERAGEAEPSCFQGVVIEPQLPTGRTSVLAGLLPKQLRALPLRARYSFADQVLVSGVNALTGVVLVRFLGLHDFGVFSMALIGVLLLAVPQGAAILAPMMSLFDQRGSISASSYLAAVLLHQAVYAALVVLLVFLAGAVLGAETGINFALVACAAVATQFQDLSRRFFFVSERPHLALISDLIAYGLRLALIAGWAWMAHLTVDIVWVIIIATSAAAFLMTVPDLLRFEPAWASIRAVTQAHKRTGSWMLASSVVGIFADNSFVMLVIGGVSGPASLGAVRAVQTVALVLNLLNLSLENFVPSAASRKVVQGGPSEMLRYVVRVSTWGVGCIAGVVVALVVFADPIMHVLYGQTFPEQRALLLAFGGYSALAYVAFVITAGLRALDAVALAFVPQTVLSVASLLVALFAVEMLGIVGAFFALLVLRVAFTAQLALALRQKVGA